MFYFFLYAFTEFDYVNLKAFLSITTLFYRKRPKEYGFMYLKLNVPSENFEKFMICFIA